jgi:hypothetical protein
VLRRSTLTAHRAAEPWDRPRNAGEVAAYQDSVVEQLRQTELTRAAEEPRATVAAERKA